MQRFSANYIFTNTGNPIRNGIVEVDNTGKVVQVIDPKGKERELARTEFHNGIIVPGFVNTHCHTELAHLKNRVEGGKGLASFVNSIRDNRLKGETASQSAIDDAINELGRLGVVAVADICNTPDSFISKEKSSVRFINLIEVLGLEPQMPDAIIDRARLIKTVQEQKGKDDCFITPHSTYSLSEKLWKQLREELGSHQVVSIHFAESKAEEMFTMHRNGPIANNYNSWGLPLNSAPAGSLKNIVKKYIPKSATVLFIHNVFLTKEDLHDISNHFSNAYFVFCPESNLYLENRLPDIDMFYKLGVKIALGTDSPASCISLSVFEQIKIIANHFPSIPFADLLLWATKNGAQALALNSTIGSIEPGKTPGLNLISPFNFSTMKPLEDSKVRRLL
ncbi:MAG: amidohydrolase family protein [Bacteroidales bacterium]